MTSQLFGSRQLMRSEDEKRHMKRNKNVGCVACQHFVFIVLCLALFEVRVEPQKERLSLLGINIRIATKRNRRYKLLLLHDSLALSQSNHDDVQAQTGGDIVDYCGYHNGAEIRCHCGSGTALGRSQCRDPARSRYNESSTRTCGGSSNDDCCSGSGKQERALGTYFSFLYPFFYLSFVRFLI
jgi:hypothetical protein